MSRARVGLLLVFSLLAGGAEPAMPELKAEPVEDGSLLRVRNTGSPPLTAVVIEMVDYPGNHFRTMQDEIMGKPVAPGETREYKVKSLMPGASPEYLKVQAAVWADGSTAGFKDRIDAIVEGRKKTLQAIRAVLAQIGEEKDGATAVRKLEKLKQDSAGGTETRRVADIIINQLKAASGPEVLDNLVQREKYLAASKPELK